MEEMSQNELLFLSHFLTEGVYLVDTESEEATDAGVAEPMSVPSTVAPPTPKVQPLTHIAAAPSPSSGVVSKISKRVVFLVGYAQGGMPLASQEALEKMTAALKLPIQEYEVINMLSVEAAPLHKYTFQALVLFGGNGRNLPFLLNYMGKREKNTVVAYNGCKVFFADTLENYLATKEAKMVLWNHMKTLFSVK